MMRNPTPPLLVVSDGCGNIFEIPEFTMTGMILATPGVPDARDLVDLPFGSDLFELPGRWPIGCDPRTRQMVTVREYQGAPVQAVAAFMAPAYVQCARAAYETQPGAPRLPLYSYTALGWRNGKFVAAGKRIDPDTRQDLRGFDFPEIERQAALMRRRYPGNRLVQHLVENCVLRYGCPAARNFVLARWECPVPSSPVCNADCVGCISKQSPQTGVCAPQDRIDFVPTVAEIVEMCVPHLEHAPRAVISFGQGCEGEPLLVGDVLSEAIKAIRQRTPRGVINLNTNASLPDMVERLFCAGLDSIRVSLNAAQPEWYAAYYRPQHYTFADVVESLRIARRFGRWASLNYFVFPGVTDQPVEIAALEALIAEVQVNMIQARNLNIDPEWYPQILNLRHAAADAIGIRAWLGRLQQRFPQLKFGYFNPPREVLE